MRHLWHILLQYRKVLKLTLSCLPDRFDNRADWHGLRRLRADSGRLDHLDQVLFRKSSFRLRICSMLIYPPVDVFLFVNAASWSHPRIAARSSAYSTNKSCHFCLKFTNKVSSVITLLIYLWWFSIWANKTDLGNKELPISYMLTVFSMFLFLLHRFKNELDCSFDVAARSLKNCARYVFCCLLHYSHVPVKHIYTEACG